MLLSCSLSMLLIIFNYINGYLGDDEVTPSECQETHTPLDPGLFLNPQV